MFVLKSKYDRAQELIAKYERGLTKWDEARAQDQRALDAERSITASLRAEIEAMKPDYLRGKEHREKAEAYNADRRNKRKAAK